MKIEGSFQDYHKLAVPCNVRTEILRESQVSFDFPTVRNCFHDHRFFNKILYFLDSEPFLRNPKELPEYES